MTVLFEKMLVELNDGMTDMGQLIEDAIVRCVYALRRGDVEAAQELVAMDDVVDHKERELENLCLRLLLTQHPVARDMRFVSAALKMLTDMERIGDQAADIAELIALAGHTIPSDFHPTFDQMAEVVVRMVKNAVNAFIAMDEVTARLVISMDDRVDALFSQIKGELTRRLQVQPELSQYALDALMIAKYFERIGDHAVNVAEWVEYAITGVHKSDGK
ncbi:MAG: phosphate signaling complex protein PhoU [Clostridia bacterium]|nr:phosphate signaling complex protein PhoU [Clostridia bacterium]